MLDKLCRLKSRKNGGGQTVYTRDGVYDPSDTNGEDLKFFEIETGGEFWDGNTANDSGWLSGPNPWNND